MPTDEPDNRYATLTTAVTALEQLQQPDILRLYEIARIYGMGLPDVDWQDIVQEALKRVASGSRRWRIEYPFMVFLKGVIRSIANEFREKAKNRQAGAGILESDTASPGDDCPGSLTQTVAGDIDQPVDWIMAEETLEKIESLFIEDQDALAVIMSDTEGFSRTEIIEMFNMSPTQYDSTRRRIRRRLLAHGIEV